MIYTTLLYLVIIALYAGTTTTTVVVVVAVCVASSSRLANKGASLPKYAKRLDPYYPSSRRRRVRSIVIFRVYHSARRMMNIHTGESGRM